MTLLKSHPLNSDLAYLSENNGYLRYGPASRILVIQPVKADHGDLRNPASKMVRYLVIARDYKSMENRWLKNNDINEDG
ncbi:hypothetical protein I7I50_11275 [Histoplasma capsulatum G186AR]|uniref:Uncharacterized protein n=1 Tax=Ajellomyces capsulatus TaxID=5037 RepID=A0A8H8D6Y2_AJECA|nr:hypothetical protein I7I52_02513 [Histoplasma capsulatum]QSS69848.1 hypothetical protein I7I50_11275 [Histoplasma capsulatum G186AR]